MLIEERGVGRKPRGEMMTRPGLANNYVLTLKWNRRLVDSSDNAAVCTYTVALLANVINRNSIEVKGENSITILKESILSYCCIKILKLQISERCDAY